MRFFYRLRRLIAWIPVLWKDEDWDYTYLYGIMAFKLRLMQRHFERHGYHINDDQDAIDIQTCALIMERLADEPVSIWDQKRSYLELFAKIFTRKSLRWWT